jgi:tetratricopeptide (TPR) repeat protein
VLLDRRRIKKWQKWIYGFMAVLMASFLIFGYTGLSQGCQNTSGSQPSVTDEIKKLKQQLAASPNATDVVLRLAQAYVGSAGGFESGSEQWATDLSTAASYYEQYDELLTGQATLEANAKRIDALQTLASIYTQLQDFENVAGAYARLTELQPDNADNFALYGLALLQAGKEKIALMAFSQYLQLAPDGPYAADIRKRIQALTSPSASPKPTTSPSQ